GLSAEIIDFVLGNGSANGFGKSAMRRDEVGHEKIDFLEECHRKIRFLPDVGDDRETAASRQEEPGDSRLPSGIRWSNSPFTNWADCADPNFRAKSTASSITT